MDFENKLKKYIKKSFCVIGNSPCEVGKGKGKIIDQYKTVIRFNDFLLNNSKDYGSKVNVWVRATNDLVIESLEQKLNQNFDLIFLRSISNKNMEFRKLIEQKNINLLVPPIKYEEKLSKILKAIPSTGILFLYILSENGYQFNDNVFGFSFFDKQDLINFGNHHYYQVDIKKQSSGIKLSKHNWDKEKEFFKKLMEK